jgi:hypothetical protein
MSEIKYTDVVDAEGPVPIHAGFLCTPNYLLRAVLYLKFKTPFMMMRIGMVDIAKIIKNDFVDYLNPSMYWRNEEGVCHSSYPGVLWNHIDPMTPDGYEKLKGEIDEYRRVIRDTGDRPLIFTCFAGKREEHHTATMIKNVDEDALFLLNTAREMYPGRSVKVFVFTPAYELKEKFDTLNEPDIVFIPLSFTIFIWDLPPQFQGAAVQEISDQYNKQIGRVCRPLLHSFPPREEFYQ